MSKNLLLVGLQRSISDAKVSEEDAQIVDDEQSTAPTVAPVDSGASEPEHEKVIDPQPAPATGTDLLADLPAFAQFDSSDESSSDVTGVDSDAIASMMDKVREM